MTAYSTPTSRETVLDGGATGYIEKPFVVEDLAEKIIGSLNKQSEGGTLQTVPLDMFIQLIEMEQKTCTIRVINKIDKRLGVLFFDNGDIMDARVDDQQGIQAAYQIFIWEKVTLSIQDECPIKDKRIEGGLQAILFDAMRMKDESGLEAADFKEPHQNAEAEEIDLDETAPASLIDVIRDRCRTVSPNLAGLEDVYPDASWSPLLRIMTDIGTRLGAGSLKTVLVKSGGASDYIVIQDDPPVVVAISDAAPIDKLLDVLSQ
jgi:CheY-like chemotaxis protein